MFPIDTVTLSIEHDGIPNRGRNVIFEPGNGEIELSLANAMHRHCQLVETWHKDGSKACGRKCRTDFGRVRRIHATQRTGRRAVCDKVQPTADV